MPEFKKLDGDYFEITRLQVTIGDRVTHREFTVVVEDEGGGPYMVLKAKHDLSFNGPSELTAVLEAIWKLATEDKP